MMKEVVVDRSWLTDICYSAAEGRTPAADRHMLYRYGLLAETYSLLMIKLLPEFISTDSDPKSIAYQYRLKHWTEPNRCIEFTSYIEDSDFNEILQEYTSNARALGGPILDDVLGCREARHCDVLIAGPPTGLIIDLLYLKGIRPRNVAFMLKAYDDTIEDMQAFYKPKALISKSFLKRLSPESFMGQLKESQILFNSAGILIEAIDEGAHPWIQKT